MESLFFFGAGASIDGGLADAFTLTENIYRLLQDNRDARAEKIFGLVVAKVIARKVRDGGSPFDRVNVEEVYDGIQRLSNRDSDIISEFVTGWDPIINSTRESINEEDVKSAFGGLLDSYQMSGFSNRMEFAFGSDGPRRVSKLLSRATDTSLVGNMGDVEASLQRALVQSLQHDDEKIEYFCKIIAIAKAYGADIATLNYDLIAERSAESVGFSFDYGLGKWNQEKIVSFPRSSNKNIRIMKLHGSLNWFAKGDDIEVKSSKQNIRFGPIPNMVFGGAGNKLRIDGPFLQLRHEFQTRLLKASTLVIVGYSFQDEHLNSIIRRWTATRRKAKLVVIDPSPVGRFAGAIGKPYKSDESGSIGELTVDLIHIQRGAADAVPILQKALESPTDLGPTRADGFLPHKGFRTLS